MNRPVIRRVTCQITTKLRRESIEQDIADIVEMEPMNTDGGKGNLQVRSPSFQLHRLL